MQLDVSTGNPVQFDDSNFDEIFYTVVMKDNSEQMDDFKHAIREEIKGLGSKGVFVDVRRSSFAKEELKKRLIIKAKLIQSVKNPGEWKECKKARIVAQAVGSKDYGKKILMSY